MDPALSRSCAILVPSRAAAGELRYTLETIALGGSEAPRGDSVFPVPDLLTRAEWYGRLHERLRDAPPMLNDFEREVMMGTAGREADEGGAPPPFKLRPGLIAEIVRLYDGLHRLRKTVDDFERLLIGDLQTDAESDRGAERLLQQTRFLASTFRRYETRVSAMERLDEHRLRRWLLERPLRLPYTYIVLAVADYVADREGLWPADFDLLTRLPLVTRIDVVTTDATLAAGFHERVLQLLPGIDEQYFNETAIARASPPHASSPPTLIAPIVETGELYFRSRDREAELSDLVRRLKQSDEPGRSLARTAVVFKRRLPYIYLAREVFGSAGVPWG